MNKVVLSSMVTTLLAISSQAMAAHWQFVSVTDGALGFIGGPGASRSARSLINVTINTGPYKQEIYGTGTFPFYGENDYLAGQGSSGSGLFTYNSYTNSYYQFVYKWVSDSPSDVPPSPNQNIGALGYQLSRVQSYGCNITTSGTTYLQNWTGSIVFLTAQLTVPYSSAAPPKAYPNAQTTAHDLVSLNSQLYVLSAKNVGGASISLTNGVTYATITNSLNDMSGNWAVNFGSNGNGPGSYTVICGTQTTSYVGPALIGALPITL